MVQFTYSAGITKATTRQLTFCVDLDVLLKILEQNRLKNVISPILAIFEFGANCVKKKKSAVCMFCTSKAIKLMPHPPKSASQAKAQQLPGNLTFNKIIEEEEGLEWEEESESKPDDDDFKDAQSRMCKLY